MIRGAAATCHVFPSEPVSKGDLWSAYREAYDDEPFVRLVAGGSGVYRYPEPKAVAGSNYARSASNSIRAMRGSSYSRRSTT